MSLVVSALEKRFGRLRVLRGASFEASPGEVIALTGQNGAGKSTVLSILAGIVSADSGLAEIGGEALIGRQSTGRRRIGFVPEKADPPRHMSAHELFTLVAALKRAEPPSEVRRDQLGIAALMNRPIGGLSLGERRRVCLAAALIGEPALLLLDEPTNGLDAAGGTLFHEVVRDAVARDVIVLVASHDTTLIDATAARVLRLEAGLITA